MQIMGREVRERSQTPTPLGPFRRLVPLRRKSRFASFRSFQVTAPKARPCMQAIQLGDDISSSGQPLHLAHQPLVVLGFVSAAISNCLQPGLRKGYSPRSPSPAPVSWVSERKLCRPRVTLRALRPGGGEAASSSRRVFCEVSREAITNKQQVSKAAIPGSVEGHEVFSSVSKLVSFVGRVQLARGVWGKGTRMGNPGPTLPVLPVGLNKLMNCQGCRAMNNRLGRCLRAGHARSHFSSRGGTMQRTGRARARMR